MPYHLRDQPPEIEDVILHLGLDVRSIRRLHVRSQEALSRHAGISQSTLSMLENGLAEGIRLETLAKIAAALGREIVLRPCEHPSEGARSPGNGRLARTDGATRISGTRRLAPGPNWHPRDTW